MKLSPLFAAVLAPLLPASTLASSAYVFTPWKVSGTQSFQSISFPFSGIRFAVGYTYSHQFPYLYGVGYSEAGFEPRPDVDGKPTLRFSISTIMSGTATSDSNCQLTSNGVRCSVEVSAPFSDSFTLEVINNGGTTWTAALVDTTTGVRGRVHIGTYTLPTGAGDIRGAGRGVLFYEWEGEGDHPCSELPYTQVTFGNPVVPDGVGSIVGPVDLFDCAGDVKYKTERTGEGLKVELGL